MRGALRDLAHRARLLQGPSVGAGQYRASQEEGARRGEAMRRVALAALIVAALSTAGAFAEKTKKPRLDLRATPRMAFSPVNVLLTAELTGGDDVEQFYCPELEWDWDDGGRSVHEADCPEYEAGKSKIERRFTAEHQYPKAGS